MLERIQFSSGPCVRFKGYDVAQVDQQYLGRSHRAKDVESFIKKQAERFRSLLNIPNDFALILAPASATGAVELALWNLLGERDAVAINMGGFSQKWCEDAAALLKERCEIQSFLDPDTSQLDTLTHDASRDLIVTASETTRALMLDPTFSWVKTQREGLVFVDGTSILGSYDFPWEKVDAMCWSWQKMFGGEPTQGLIALSPAAQQRLKSYTPEWVIPKLFTIGPRTLQSVSINTISLLVVSDMACVLDLIEERGGQKYLQSQIEKNKTVLYTWLRQEKNFDFLVQQENHRAHSVTTIDFAGSLSESITQRYGEGFEAVDAFVWDLIGFMQEKSYALDIKYYMGQKPGLRIWHGPTVEASDLELMLARLSKVAQCWVETGCFQVKVAS